jgi:hypothetical protein
VSKSLSSFKIGISNDRNAVQVIYRSALFRRNLEGPERGANAAQTKIPLEVTQENAKKSRFPAAKPKV